MASEFSRGGFPLSGDPAAGRVMHVGERPYCTVCGVVIFGDEDYLPNECPFTGDGRHRYPDGSSCPPSPRQARLIELDRVVEETRGLENLDPRYMP